MRRNGVSQVATMTLNHLENEIIRGPEFAEPRIHFAVNCASIGCPPLRAIPYAAEDLEESLEAQTQQFIRRNNPAPRPHTGGKQTIRMVLGRL